MIYYKVSFTVVHVDFEADELFKLLPMLQRLDEMTPEEQRAVQDLFIKWNEEYTRFDDDQPINARHKAFAFVNDKVNELMTKEGYQPAHKFLESVKPKDKTFLFTIYCCWDGNAIPVARPVNTPGIQQYKAAEYALYQTYGFDIGSEAPATEFIPELVRTIEVIPE